MRLESMTPAQQDDRRSRAVAVEGDVQTRPLAPSQMNVQQVSGVTCPVCNATRISRVAELQSNGSHAVMRCERCRLEFVHPFLPSTSSDTSSVTSDGYLHSMRTEYEALLPRIRYRTRRRLELYQQLLGRAPARILDVG